MSSMSSQAVVFATAMAVSGTVIFLTLSRQKIFMTTSQLSGNLQNSQPENQALRSCLSKDGKKTERKKKRVHFAENVKDPIGNGEEFRKFNSRNCRNESSNSRGMPENRISLYNGIIRDRVQRMECSY